MMVGIDKICKTKFVGWGFWMSDVTYDFEEYLKPI